MAVTAAASPAFVGGVDACPLHRREERLIFPGRHSVHLIPDMDGKLKGPGLLYCPVAAESGILADGFHWQAIGGQFLEDKVVHGFGTAEEEGHVPDVDIFLQQGGGDETVLIAGPLLVAEDIDNLQTLLRQGVQLRFEGNAGLVSCAVEQGHLIVLIPLCHALCHGEEGGDACSACDAGDMLFVPQGLIVEFAGGLRHGKAVSGLGFLVQIAGEETGLLHAQYQFVLQGFPGAGGDRIGAADKAFPHLALKRYILPCPEEGKSGGIQAAEGEFPHSGGKGPYRGQLHLHGTGVKGLSQHIGAVGLGQRGVGAVGQSFPPVGDQLFESQHIHKAEDLFLEIHLTSPPA